MINLTNRKRTTRAWNPYCANLDSRSALEDAQSFCAASQTRAYSYDSPFWDGSAARWIAGLMFRLRAKQGSVCPADVHEALELPRSDLLALLKGGANVPFAAAVASFLESGSQNAETVLATAQMYYRIFQNLDIASVTSADEFWFETLFKPTVLILEISQCDAEQVRPLLNLFFSQLFREAARYAETQPGCRLAIPLNLYMDDFAASLGRIPEMGQHLNLSRSRDIRVVAAIQSLSQIDHFYGSEAGSVISGFSTYIVKSPVSQSDAEWASAHSGTMTVESIDMNQNLDSQLCQRLGNRFPDNPLDWSSSLIARRHSAGPRALPLRACVDRDSAGRSRIPGMVPPRLRSARTGSTNGDGRQKATEEVATAEATGVEEQALRADLATRCC